MNQYLTQSEIEKIQNLCFKNPVKACAIAQVIINTCQVVSCSTYARLKGKSKRTVQYKAKNLNKISIETRNFISLNL
jgi:hypothetical protein